MSITLGSMLFKIVIYAIGLISVFGITLSSQTNLSKAMERFRLNRDIKLKSWTNTWIEYKWLRTYHMLLSSTIRFYTLHHFSKIVVTQALLFVSLTVMLFSVLREFTFSIGSSFVLVLLLPTAALYFIHKRRESDIQNNLVEISIKLFQEYEKSGKHMLFALKNTAENLDGPGQVAFSKLFARMHDDDRMKQLGAETFAFTIGKFRGKNLATIILRACKEGVIVSDLLQNLVEDITNFNKRTRDAETDASDTALIGYFILPLLGGFYIFNKVYLFHEDSFYYQFQTVAGLKSFILAFTFGVIGIGLAMIVKKPKRKTFRRKL